MSSFYLTYNLCHSIIIIRWCTDSHNVGVRRWSSPTTVCPGPIRLDLVVTSASPLLVVRVVFLSGSGVYCEGRCVCIELLLIFLVLLCHVACEAEHEMMGLIYMLNVKLTTLTEIRAVHMTWWWVMLVRVNTLNLLLVLNDGRVCNLLFRTYLERLLKKLLRGPWVRGHSTHHIITFHN